MLSLCTDTVLGLDTLLLLLISSCSTHVCLGCAGKLCMVSGLQVSSHQISSQQLRQQPDIAEKSVGRLTWECLHKLEGSFCRSLCLNRHCHKSDSLEIKKRKVTSLGVTTGASKPRGGPSLMP